MKCFVPAAIATGLLAGSVAAQDPKPDTAAESKVAAALKGHTFRLNGDTLEKADAGKLPEVIAVYHSMWGCAGCMPVTQQIAAIYDRAGPAGERKFEVVLVSVSGGEEIMAKYMKKMGMKWLALAPAENEKNEIALIGRKEFVPNLVLIAPDGTPISTDTDESLARLEKLVPAAKP